MKGSIHIIVQNERVKYEFNLRRNLTIIRGDSATGKTTLIDMMREYKSLGEDSGVELLCEKECVVIDGNGWERQLSDVAQSIVFVDEGNRFVSSVEFARYISLFFLGAFFYRVTNRKVKRYILEIQQERLEQGVSE